MHRSHPPAKALPVPLRLPGERAGVPQPRLPLVPQGRGLPFIPQLHAVACSPRDALAPLHTKNADVTLHTDKRQAA